MKHIRTSSRRKEFEVLISTRTAQCAVMTLNPSDASDEQPHNEHPHAEQWLYVVSGTGQAISKRGTTRRSIKLGPGSLLLIEERELHQIKCTGKSALVTINFYAPPAYTPSGEPRR